MYDGKLKIRLDPKPLAKRVKSLVQVTDVAEDLCCVIMIFHTVIVLRTRLKTVPSHISGH
jgi:hypothetical protein